MRRYTCLEYDGEDMSDSKLVSRTDSEVEDDFKFDVLENEKVYKSKVICKGTGRLCFLRNGHVTLENIR